MNSNESPYSVREITTDDVPFIVDYWTKSSPDFLVGMGVDLSKLPSAESLNVMLHDQISKDYKDKQSYAMIWLIDGKPSGHCNINMITFGEQAHMHLHMWNSTSRRSGAGRNLVRLSIPYFFRNYQLKKLICEPYALNEAPSKTLPYCGFKFVKEYVTIPGSLSFEQPVKQWILTAEEFENSNQQTIK